MKHIVRTMLKRLESSCHDELISWASPVPCFGDLQHASVATLGINPSNREFVDDEGEELTNRDRRFHTLNSFGLDHWSQARNGEIEQIIESCAEYFFRNPYGVWFNRLNPIVGATGCSYYDRLFPACHIDLLPFATDAKWGSLFASRRRKILQENADLLVQLIQASNLELIILNGQSVVSEFVAVTDVELESEPMLDWSLPRSNGSDVIGISYVGTCEEICDEPLARPLRVLGFNHNIQSSFGVTTQVVGSIARWIGEHGRALEHA
jgi:hypothetical protein